MKTNTMRSLIWGITVLLLFQYGQVFAQGNGLPFVQHEVVVKLNRASDLAAIASQYGLHPTPIAQMGDRPVFRLRVTSNIPVEQVVSLLQADPLSRVSVAEPNYIISTPVAGGTPWSLGGSWSIGWPFWNSLLGARAYGTQWMRQRLDLAAAHSVTRGIGITVAVLDTGIDVDHPLFTGKLMPGYDFVDNDNDPSEVGTASNPAFGHGTHVAGIVATVAPEAKIMPIRVLDQNGEGNVWRLARALVYAADPDGNPNTDDGADIINLSLGTTGKTDLVKRLIAAETDDGTGEEDPGLPQLGHPGIVVVVAAGNTGNSTKIYPAAEHDVPGLIAVGASGVNDTISDFSTRGEWVELMAPGDRIVSAVPGGRYGIWRGTSMAAPIVSGIAALVRSRYPGLKPNAVFEQIRRSSVSCNGAISRRVDAKRSVTIAP
ncbi:MAG: S8 family serine peptidase [Pyrinomonadaceae bacterium]